ncbi:MAG: transposase [Anaerolineales bacterium]|nr:transposase [Anaerolineales bacterium]
MAEIHSILVVTGSPSFGELIQQTLEENGLYEVVLANGIAEALQRVEIMKFSVAILDSELKDGSLQTLAPALLHYLPDLRLIAIPPDNDPENPILAQISACNYLTKPFYLPDLLDTISEVLKQPSSQKEPVSASDSPSSNIPTQSDPDPSPAWLEDVSVAAQYLTRLSLESSAQAALIVRDNNLWAYAGGLSQPAALELTRLVAEFWSIGRQAGTARDGKSAQSGDIVRFVRLEATNGDHMLYATALNKGMVLALVFDAETPFSKIRTQASMLARALSSPSSEQSKASTYPQRSAARPSIAAASVPSLQPPPIRPLLDDVPPPMPNAKPATPLPQPVAMPISQQIDVQPPPELPVESRAVEQHTETTPPSPEEQTIPAVIAQPLSTPTEADAKPDQRPATDAMQLQPPTPVLAGLYYACLLIPRMPQHKLTGNLVGDLRKWIQRLCVAFGWRLEHLAIRPDSIQWIVGISPNVSPGYLMRITRQHLSKNIFEDYPSLARDNPSGDFWAPGYLIMSSHKPPPEHLVNEFIQHTRYQQGLPEIETKPLP